MPPGIGYGTNINPQIIMRALRQRGLLPPEDPRQPSFVPQQDVNPPQVSPMAGGQQQSGLNRFLKTPGLQNALLTTGSALLAQKDRAGSLGGALGRALPAGMQAFQQGQQSAALDEALAGAPPQMQRLIAGLPLAQKAQLAMQMATARPPDPVVVGDNLVRPDSGEVVYEGEDEPPSAIQEMEAYIAAHPDLPRSEAIDQWYEARRGPGTTVNVGQKDAAREALVDIEAGDVEEAMAAARTARDQLSSLGQIERLLDEGVETGALEDRLLPARQLAAAFGVGDADRLIAQENFRALTNEIAIGMTQQLSGQISERELEFVRAAVPNLGSTPEANRRLVEIGKAANETAIAVAEAKREHFRENGTLEGFESKRREIVQEMLLDQLPDADGSTVDPNARLEELVRQGLSFEEIQKIARREGWAR